MEWGLDALLFSFSSSVKGKKKEWPSAGKVLSQAAYGAQGFEENSKADASHMLDIFLNKDKGKLTYTENS